MLYDCSACKRTFASQQSLDQHLASQAHTAKCDLCHRTFRSRQAYIQHVQCSKMHKVSVPGTSIVQPSESIQSQYPQSSNSSPAQPTDLRQLAALTPNSSTSHVIIHSEESSIQDVDHRWSVIPFPEQPAVLDALSQNCHSSNDLWTNKYRLQRYTAEDLAGLRKCRNCGGMFLRVQSYMR